MEWALDMVTDLPRARYAASALDGGTGTGAGQGNSGYPTVQVTRHFTTGGRTWEGAAPRPTNPYSSGNT